MRLIPHSITLGIAAGLLTTSAYAAPYTLTIFHTNDLHGRTDHYPQLITTLDEARERFGDGLLLYAGDIFSGTLYFTEYQGQDAISS